MSAIRFALCVAHFDLLNPPALWRPFLVDRAVVDDKENLMPQIKQILPYVTFVRTNLVTQVQEILTYLRGKGGAESRLHDKRSIGIGGHIDDIPAEGQSLTDYIADETVREIYEELPGMFTEESKPSLREVILNALLNSETLNYIDIRVAEVDCVHLGLSILIDVTDEPGAMLDALDGEENQVKDLRWVPIDELADEIMKDKYEGWSRYVLWTSFPNGVSPEDTFEALDMGEVPMYFGPGETNENYPEAEDVVV
jgi:predicted NUDIX family phosphoesterase